ncbi:GNAT family N-acetyltransferase [Methanobrevibacter sp. V14]|uniref:GNAT family N-acetyltransferase n=1 Tax=Methanobrevibacter sp. V14 TaxID=3064280 RepID=UPI002734ACD3|nr:GNAT family N-acetyltransferase [Methanobrevibacter sp. V14]
MIIKTKNLCLRHWRKSDAESLYNLAKNPNIGPVAGWPPHKSIDYSLNIINTVFARDECYAVTKNDDLIGCAELLIHPDTNHWWGEDSAELGYWIGSQYQGRGYASEASKALISRAFNQLNIKRIFATYKSENIQSKRVLEKLGFEYYSQLNNIDYLNRPFREIAVILEK